MPIEIRELVIKATITDSAVESGKDSDIPSVASSEDGEIIESLVTLCVEKVLEIINDKEER